MLIVIFVILRAGLYLKFNPFPYTTLFRSHIYYDPPDSPRWGEYHVNAPNALMLVDSQGRRTGKDPITGILYREIPNTSYGEDQSKPGAISGELFTTNLPNGQYMIYVLRGQ